MSKAIASDVLTIPFELVNGLIIVDASIDDEEGKFIFDTGADAILLNRSGIKGERVTFQSLSGSLNASSTNISKFSIGSLQKENILAFTTNLSDVEDFLHMEIAGILGCNVFIPYSLYIDYKGGLLTISREKLGLPFSEKWDYIDFDIKSGIPVVNVEIDGQVHQFALDSGATSHFLDDDLQKKFRPLFKTGKGEVEIITAGNIRTKSEKVILSVFSIKNLNFLNQVFCVKDFDSVNKNTGAELSGIIALSGITRTFIAIDLENNRLYF